MVRMDCPGSLNGYVLMIRFKRWATLWSMGNTRLQALAVGDRLERQDFLLAKYIQLLPAETLKAKAAQKRYSWKKRVASRPSLGNELPDCMLIECYNPNSYNVSMTLTIRNDKDSSIPFQSLLPMQPGFNKHRIGMTEIARVVDVSSRFKLELAANQITDGCTLFFGAMDFVVDGADRQPSETKELNYGTRESQAKAKLCKCVIWDLDNTLWDGILIEDGAENLRLKPGVREILKTLDERGILISAVSKNNHEDGMAALRRFEIADYFLYPQISWNPKSQGVHQVAASLNVGIDSLLFVDDSIFEREEVRRVYPEVAVLDAAEYLTIPDRTDCQAPVTAESRKRRLLYKEQQVRDVERESFKGDYFAFLRDCHLRLTVRPMTEVNLERVHELTQRTNQMNFSGNRYTRDQLSNLLHDAGMDTYVLDCEDRFGAYGTVGFCTVRRAERLMTDLMFSCRIQAKRVEHAFVSCILRQYRQLSGEDFFVNYRRTSKNAAPGKVFEDLGFEPLDQFDGVARLVHRKETEIPNDGIVDVEVAVNGRHMSGVANL
jgi:FkbH-like protein